MVDFLFIVTLKLQIKRNSGAKPLWTNVFFIFKY